MAPVNPQVSRETVQAYCSDLSRRKRVWLVHVDRRQLCWTMLDVERLVDELDRLISMTATSVLLCSNGTRERLRSFGFAMGRSIGS
jgi:hypothetical protein